MSEGEYREFDDGWNPPSLDEEKSTQAREKERPILFDLLQDLIKFRLYHVIVFLSFFTIVSLLVLFNILMDPSDLKGRNFGSQIRILDQPTLTVSSFTIGSPLPSEFRVRVTNAQGFGVKDRVVTAYLSPSKALTTSARHIPGLSRYGFSCIDPISLGTLDGVRFGEVCENVYRNYSSKTNEYGEAIFDSQIRMDVSLPDTYHIDFVCDNAIIATDNFELLSNVSSISFENTVLRNSSLFGEEISISVKVILKDNGNNPLSDRHVHLYSYAPFGGYGVFEAGQIQDPTTTSRSDDVSSTFIFPDWQRFLGGGFMESKIAILKNTHVVSDKNGYANFTNVHVIGANCRHLYFGVACEGQFKPLPGSEPCVVDPSIDTVSTVNIVNSENIDEVVVELEHFQTAPKVAVTTDSGKVLGGKQVFAMILSSCGIQLPAFQPRDVRAYSRWLFDMEPGRFRDKSLLGAVAVTNSEGIADFGTLTFDSFGLNGDYTLVFLCEGVRSGVTPTITVRSRASGIIPLDGDTRMLDLLSSFRLNKVETLSRGIFRTFLSGTVPWMRFTLQDHTGSVVPGKQGYITLVPGSGDSSHPARISAALLPGKRREGSKFVDYNPYEIRIVEVLSGFDESVEEFYHVRVNFGTDIDFMDIGKVSFTSGCGSPAESPLLSKPRYLLPLSIPNFAMNNNDYTVSFSAYDSCERSVPIPGDTSVRWSSQKFKVIEGIYSPFSWFYGYLVDGKGSEMQLYYGFKNYEINDGILYVKLNFYMFATGLSKYFPSSAVLQSLGRAVTSVDGGVYLVPLIVEFSWGESKYIHYVDSLLGNSSFWMQQGVNSVKSVAVVGQNLHSSSQSTALQGSFFAAGLDWNGQVISRRGVPVVAIAIPAVEHMDGNLCYVGVEGQSLQFTISELLQSKRMTLNPLTYTNDNGIANLLDGWPDSASCFVCYPGKTYFFVSVNGVFASLGQPVNCKSLSQMYEPSIVTQPSKNSVYLGEPLNFRLKFPHATSALVDPVNCAQCVYVSTVRNGECNFDDSWDWNVLQVITKDKDYFRGSYVPCILGRCKGQYCSCSGISVAQAADSQPDIQFCFSFGNPRLVDSPVVVISSKIYHVLSPFELSFSGDDIINGTNITQPVKALSDIQLEDLPSMDIRFLPQAPAKIMIFLSVHVTSKKDGYWDSYQVPKVRQITGAGIIQEKPTFFMLRNTDLNQISLSISYSVNGIRGPSISLMNVDAPDLFTLTASVSPHVSSVNSTPEADYGVVRMAPFDFMDADVYTFFYNKWKITDYPNADVILEPLYCRNADESVDLQTLTSDLMGDIESVIDECVSASVDSLNGYANLKNNEGKTQGAELLETFQVSYSNQNDSFYYGFIRQIQYSEAQAGKASLTDWTFSSGLSGLYLMPLIINNYESVLYDTTVGTPLFAFLDNPVSNMEISDCPSSVRVPDLLNHFQVKVNFKDPEKYSTLPEETWTVKLRFNLEECHESFDFCVADVTAEYQGNNDYVERKVDPKTHIADFSDVNLLSGSSGDYSFEFDCAGVRQSVSVKVVNTGSIDPTNLSSYEIYVAIFAILFLPQFIANTHTRKKWIWFTLSVLGLTIVYFVGGILFSADMWKRSSGQVQYFGRTLLIIALFNMLLVVIGLIYILYVQFAGKHFSLSHATVRRSRNIDLVKRLLRREFRLADDVDDVIPSSTQSNKNDNNEDLTAYEKLKVTCSRCWSWIFDVFKSEKNCHAAYETKRDFFFPVRLFFGLVLSSWIILLCIFCLVILCLWILYFLDTTFMLFLQYSDSAYVASLEVSSSTTGQFLTGYADETLQEYGYTSGPLLQNLFMTILSSVEDAEDFYKQLRWALIFTFAFCCGVCLLVFVLCWIFMIRCYRQRVMKLRQGIYFVDVSRMEYTAARASDYVGYQVSTSLLGFLLLFFMLFLLVFLMCFDTTREYIIDTIGTLIISFLLGILFIRLIVAFVVEIFVVDRFRILRRGVYGIYDFSMLVFGLATGLASAIYALILALIVLVVEMQRVDICRVSEFFGPYSDPGFLAYTCMIISDTVYNNPVASVFTEILQEFVKKKPEEDHSDMIEMMNRSAVRVSKIARNRWFLAYTLMKNEELHELSALRAHSIEERKNKREEILSRKQ